MKTKEEIQAAFDALVAAAKFASKNDPESYEVCANSAMALGWVLEVGGDVTIGFNELLLGAAWAQSRPVPAG